MKRLVYISFENSENRDSGVNKKINGQIQAFEDEGYKTDLVARYKDTFAIYESNIDPVVLKTKKAWRIEICDWVAEHSSDFDIAYIRFQFFCPFVFHMVQSLHKAGVKTIMEIPTYPYAPELKKQGLKGVPKLIIDSTFKGLCSKYIDSFAAPLYSDPILGKQCLEIRNGIDLHDVLPRNARSSDGVISLVGVAMMAPWHGYDRLIRGIHKYYMNGGRRNVILHLVGEGAATPEYTSLINEFNLSEHVIQHGRMHGKELDAMYDIADIGVGSLGIHRTDVKKTNTLKIMEYMAKGIPVICEHSEFGIPLTSKYRLTVSDDEQSIDLIKIIDFYDSIYSGKDISKIINEIRMECRENCNVKVGLNEVLRFMQE